MIDSDVSALVETFLTGWQPQASRTDALRARFDAGLAWIDRPVGLGGLGLPPDHRIAVDELFADAGFPDNNPQAIGIGLGMAAPTIFAVGTDDQKGRFLRPLWTGEEVWCQLFSEPGAGSDLANVGTRAVRTNDGWIVNGQKVWTSSAHTATWGLLLARSDPGLPKHSGLTYFACDMRADGVEVRPLRQITGEAEFNEVFLTDVFIPDTDRLGAVNEGWLVAMTTVGAERVALARGDVRQEQTMLDVVERTWRAVPARTRELMGERFMTLWIESRAAELAVAQARQRLQTRQPGPEGSALKITFARLAQELSALEMELLGDEGLAYGEWRMVRPENVNLTGRDAGYRYLRAKGNSIEGGTSEVLLNIIAEKVLNLPLESRPDKGIAWKDSLK